MEKVYTVCMIIGIGIPLLTLLLGGITDLFDGLLEGISGIFDSLNLHFDFSIDMGDTSLCLLPFSIQSICAGLLIYGAIGKMIYNGKNGLMVNLIAGGIGYVAAITVQTLIRKLKKVEHTTYTKEQLLLYDGKVVNTIVAGGFGSISITTLDGITTTYPAKAEDKNQVIKQGEIVTIIKFEKNIAIVKEKDLTKKYSSEIK